MEYEVFCKAKAVTLNRYQRAGYWSVKKPEERLQKNWKENVNVAISMDNLMRLQ
jgi:hypothetical protein